MGYENGHLNDDFRLGAQLVRSTASKTRGFSNASSAVLPMLQPMRSFATAVAIRWHGQAWPLEELSPPLLVLDGLTSATNLGQPLDFFKCGEAWRHCSWLAEKLDLRPNLGSYKKRCVRLHIWDICLFWYTLWHCIYFTYMHLVFQAFTLASI